MQTTINTTEPLLDEYEVADILKIKVSTLRSWRVKGGKLPFSRIGGRMIRYHPADIRDFIEASKATSTTEADYA